MNNVKNLLWYACPPIVSKVLALAILPILTRLLTPGELGLVTIAMVVAGLIELVVLPGLEGLYLRYGFSRYSQREIEFSSGFQTLLGLHLLILFALFPVASLLAYYLSLSFAKNLPALFLITAVLATGLTSLHAPYLSYLRATEQVRKLAHFQVAESLLKCCVTILGLFIFNWGAVSLLMAELIPALFLFPASLPIFRYLNLKKGKELLNSQLLRALIASGPDALVFWAFTALDRFFLNFFHGETVTGLYTAIYALGSFVVSIEFIFQRHVKVLIYALRTENGKGRTEIHRFFLGNLELFLALTALVALSSPVFLPWFLGPKFLVASDLVPFVCLIALLRVPEFFFKTLCWADNQKRRLSLSNLVALLVFILSNFTLIPKLGYKGAAISGILGLLTYPIYIMTNRQHFKELIIQWKEVSLLMWVSLIGLFISFAGISPGLASWVVIPVFAFGIAGLKRYIFTLNEATTR